MYYKNKENKPYYEPSQSIIERDGLIKITKEEFNQIVYDINNPPPTKEQIAEQVRTERDAKIASVRWRIERAKDEAALDIPLTEPLEPLLQYVQALRDVPQQSGFPDNVEWPVEPEQN